MKRTKKLLALLLSALMVLSMGMTVFADAPTNPGSITINDSIKDKVYELYRIFDLTGTDTTGDSTYDNVAYTIDSAWTGFFASTAPGAAYLVDSNSGSLNSITVSGATKFINITDSNVAAFAEAALAFAVANDIDPVTTATGIAPTGSPASSDLVVDDLPLGYYMVYPRGAADIKDGKASICSLTSTIPAAEIEIKAEYPTIDKKIIENSTEVTVNEAGIGDEVPYRITTKIPDMTGYEFYFFVAHDTLSSGLTLKNTVNESGKNTGFTVKIGTTTLVEGTDYDVDIDGQSFRIIFKNMVSRTADTGKTVTIEYSATLNENALINDANTNTAKIEYSNDPHVTPECDEGVEPDNPDDPTDPKYKHNQGGGETPKLTEESADSETKTYTTSLTLLKVDGSGNILSGAEFTLSGDTHIVKVTTAVSFVEAADGTYYKLTNGKYTKDAPVATHVEEAVDGEYVVKESDYDLTDLEEGVGYFTIDDITYRVIQYDDETGDPDIVGDPQRYKYILGNTGDYASTTQKYKKTESTTTLDSKASTPAIVKGTVDATTGLLTFTGLGAGTYTLTESVTPAGYNTIEPITFTVSFDSGSKTFSGNNSINLELTEIENKSGTILPATGGMGTVLFITIGAVLFMATGIILTAKKRLYNEGV